MMIQALRGRNKQIGYFFRGALQFARQRTINAIARFVTGIIFCAYERSAAGIGRAIVDSPTITALRDFLRSKLLTPKLAKILDWKTCQNIRKALRNPRNRLGSIAVAVDSTFKGTLSRLAHHLFRPGKGDRIGNHIFVFAVLVFPDGTRLPLRPRQKKAGKHAPSQVDLAAEIVRSLAESLSGYSVVVVADAFFFSKKILKAVHASRFHYVIAAKGNTVRTDKSNLESLLRNIRLTGSCVTLPFSRGERQKRFSVAMRHFDLRCGGTQAVVFSRPFNKRGALVKFLVSDLLDATAAEIVRLYALRWQVELFFREAKMYLGLDQYRTSGEHAPENFAMLVTLAYQFLHWREAASGGSMTTLARIRELADEIAADNILTIERAAITRHRRKKIRAHFHLDHQQKAHESRQAKKPSRGRRAAS
jgi:hypothetical protein